LEYRNNILIFLFYTTITAAQIERPAASAPADSAASAAVVATGAPNVNSPPSARRADRASFGAGARPLAPTGDPDARVGPGQWLESSQYL
jgi:hypothetical protein